MHCRGFFYVLYEVREDLGEGAFGKVVRVRRRRDGRMFVAKIMHDRGLSEGARQEVCPPGHGVADLPMPLVRAWTGVWSMCGSGAER